MDSQMFEIFFVVISAILISITGIKWKKLTPLHKVALIFGVLTSSLIAYNQFRKYKKEKLIERIKADIGNIEDLNNVIYPSVEIDNSGINVNYVGTKSLMFKTDQGPLLELYIQNNQLYVNIVIHDLDGKTVAAIDKNEWVVFLDGYDYNNDKTAFELVTKGEKEVLFQINLKDGIAHVGGFLLDKNGAGFYLAKKANAVKQAVLTTIQKGETKTKATMFAEPLTPIFKYPRKTHLGERANPD